MYGDTKKKNSIICFVYCLIAVSALLFIFIKKFGFVLSSNDDVMLRSIASGNYTGNPDAHLIYIMYPLGLIFKLLYMVAPGASWYDIIMVGIHVLCFFLLVIRVGSCFERLTNKLVVSTIVLALLFVFEAKYVVLHQYTVLSGMCAAVAIFWAATYEKEENKTSTLIVVFVMQLLSLWLRKQMFFLSLPFFALVLLFVIFSNNDTGYERSEKIHNVLPSILLMAILVGASFIVEYIAYSSPEWKSFKEYNHERTQVYDYNKLPDYYDNTDFYDELGIGEAQYTALREYDVLVVEDMDAEKLSLLADRADELKKEWEQYYSVPRKAIIDAVNTMKALNGSFLGVMVTVSHFLLLLFFIMKDEIIGGVVTVASYVYEWLFMGYFTYLTRLPDRVVQGYLMLSLVFLMALFVVMLRRERASKDPSIVWQIMLSVLAVMILGSIGLSSARTLLDETKQAQEKALAWQELSTYMKSSPDRIYVLNTSVVASSNALMFNKDSSEAFNSIKAGNWTLGGPLESMHEEKLLEMSFANAVGDADNIYYILPADKNTDWLTECLGRDSELEVADEITLSNGESYKIIHI